MSSRPEYLLVRSPAPQVAPPALDDAQQRVVRHRGGPLLVLAGPGTGKTTAIVESVVHRVTERRIDPARLLVLTFSRKAAEELRERITLRLARTMRTPLAFTFHSYAYALVRREFTLAGEAPPALLSGPQQLLEVSRLLRGEAEDGGTRWPPRLRPALATRGFAAELRDFLLRAAERGLDGAALARLGRQRGRDDWVAAGRFLTRYAARFDLAPVPAYDYAEIVRIAGGLLRRSATRDRERRAYDAVLVDEYQDTDPAQADLLGALAGDGRELIAVGDPDQSIYAFRGADPRAVSRFRDRFRNPDGSPAPVVALRTCRRSGPVLLQATRRVARRLPSALSALGAADADTERDHRAMIPAVAHPGRARIIVASGANQEAAVIADTLRRAHLGEGIGWSSMAVLVRSASRQVPVLRRALMAAGVPVAVTGDDLPLTAEPGTRPLLKLLACAVVPGALDEEAAAELLTGPLGGIDPLGLRRLRRALATAARSAGDPEPAEPLAAALRDPANLVPAGWAPGLPDGRLADPVPAESAAAAALAGPLAAARKVAGLLALARDTAAGRAPGAVQRPATPHEVLWAVWNASGLADTWQEASAAGGSRGAAADADLDAVVALFEAAARFSQQVRRGSVRLFLDSLSGQEIAGDTLAARAPAGDAVSLLTAHRAKGLEWDVVVVAGVLEGTWPDLRLRSSLLGMDELVDAAADSPAADAGPDAAAAAMASRLLDEERRLFYVAVTRARRQLLVTAHGGDDSDERPSRFLAELAGDAIEIEQDARTVCPPGGASVAGPADLAEPATAGGAGQDQAGAAPGPEPGALPAVLPDGWGGRRWLSLPALTAELRRAAGDRGLPAPLRRAAARQLARLAAAGVRGASPRQWYALTELSEPGPIVSGPVTVSPSQVESFAVCGLRWLLESAAGFGSPSAARHFGVVIHAAAALAAQGADDAEISKRIDEIWHHLDFGSRWYSQKQRQQAELMVRRFLDWHRANPRQLVAVERALRVQAGNVLITGRVDRLERDDSGAAIVVDLKTGTARPADDDLDRHPQLGVYQLAVLLGAFAELGLTQPGGAELVQVGRAALRARVRVQRQQPLGDDPDPGWAGRLVETVAAGMSQPVFQARVNPGCRTCPVASCCPVHERGGQVTP
jgi:superfamily I DNA/RNA helicase/RecB family exonuclease